MIRYRIRASGDVVSKQEVKKLHPNTSLPSVWGENVCDGLGIDPVLFTPKPSPSSAYKLVTEAAPIQDSEGNWVGAWSEQDMSTDEQAAHDIEIALRERINRDDLLKETDHYGLSDVTMTDAMTTYRQALRDVPQQAEFPHTITWPTKPE